MAHVEVEVRRHDDRTVIVTAAGNLGVSEVVHLHRGLTDALAMKPDTAVIDLGGLGFISSMAISSLLTFQRAMDERGGTVAIARPQELVRDTLITAKLDRVFTLVDSIDEALHAGE